MIQSSPTAATGAPDAPPAQTGPISKGVQNFEIKSGLETICTFTDSLSQGTLKLVKVVDNLGESGPGYKGVSDFPLTIDGTSTTSGTAATVTAGNHTIAETSQAGYSVGTWSCDDGTTGTPGSTSATVNISGGENVTCTMTNTLIATPALNITKVAQESSVDAAGDLIHYTLTVTNTGNQTLTGVEVSDPRIANLDCDDQTPGNQTTGFTLAPGGTLTCTGTYTVTQGDIDDNGGGDGDIDNTATADSNQTGPDTDSAVVPITQAPALNITKVAQASSVDAAGDLIHYTLTVTNTGNQTLTGVEVSDPRIANLDCDDQTPGNQTTGFTLAPGGTLTCTGTYTRHAGDIDDNGGGDGDIDNTATADSQPDRPGHRQRGRADHPGPGAEHHQGTARGELGRRGRRPDPLHAHGHQHRQPDAHWGGRSPTRVIADLDCDDQTPGDQTTGFALAPGGTADLHGAPTRSRRVTSTTTAAATATSTTPPRPTRTRPARTPTSAVVPITQAPALNITKVARESSVDAAGDLIHYTLTVTNTGNQTLTGRGGLRPADRQLDCDDLTSGDQTTGFTLAPGGTLTCTGTYTRHAG